MNEYVIINYANGDSKQFVKGEGNDSYENIAKISSIDYYKDGELI